MNYPSREDGKTEKEGIRHGVQHQFQAGSVSFSCMLSLSAFYFVGTMLFLVPDTNSELYKNKITVFLSDRKLNFRLVANELSVTFFDVINSSRKITRRG